MKDLFEELGELLDPKKHPKVTIEEKVFTVIPSPTGDPSKYILIMDLPKRFYIDPEAPETGQVELFNGKAPDYFAESTEKLGKLLSQAKSPAIKMKGKPKPGSMIAKALDQAKPNTVMLDGHSFEMDENKRAIGYTPVEGNFLEEVEKVKEYYNSSDIKEKCFVGIDPGKAGAIVAVNNQDGIVGKWVIPLIGSDVDAKGIWDILNGLKQQYNITLILEEVHSLRKMSASTNFSMGHTLGIILGIVIASQVRLIRIAPKAWQKEVWITSEIEYLPKKPEQKNPSINTKLTSMKAAHRLFPNADFRKSARATNDHDGICDAVCLAEYGRRKNL